MAWTRVHSVLGIFRIKFDVIQKIKSMYSTARKSNLPIPLIFGILLICGGPMMGILGVRKIEDDERKEILGQWIPPEILGGFLVSKGYTMENLENLKVLVTEHRQGTCAKTFHAE